MRALPVALLVGLAACSAGGPASVSASRAAYIAQGDTICRIFETQTSELGSPPDLTGAPTPAQLMVFGTYLASEQPIITTAVRALSALPVPTDGSAEIANINTQDEALLPELAAVVTEAQAGRLDGFAAAFTTFDTANTLVAKAQKDFGFTVCGGDTLAS